MAQYQFPDMSVDEAVEFFATDGKLRNIAGSTLSSPDFRKPDPQRWLQIYGGIFELLTSVPYENIRQEVIHLGMTNTTVESVEICEESAHLCLFTLYMGRLLATCGFTDFVVKDIANPTTKRLLKIVSALVNFYKFQTGRVEIYEELLENRMRENEHYIQLVRANDEIRQKINNIKATQAEKEPHILQLQNEIRDQSTKMGENIKGETRIRKSIAEQKAKVAENKANNDQLRVQILESKKLGEKLSRQIVHSPDRLKEEKKRTQAHLTHLRQSNEERVQRVLELRQQLERLRVVEEESEQAQKIMKGIMTDVDKEKECSGEIGKIQDQIQSTEEAIQAVCTKEQEINTGISSKQEKISKLSLQHHHRMAGAKETLQQFAGQLELERGQNSDEKDQARGINQQKRVVLDNLEADLVTKENSMELMRFVYAESLEKLEAYHAKLASSWEKGQLQLE